MIRRRRLDESTPSPSSWDELLPARAAGRIILGVVWLVSVAAFAASIYGFSQLDQDRLPMILIVLGIIVFAVSFMVAAPVTAIVLYSVARYLYYYLAYTAVRATLVVKTDRNSYRPGDDVRISISLETDQSMKIASGRVRLRRDIREGDYGSPDVLSEIPLPLPRGGKPLPPGESYESTVVLSLPADALEDPQGSATASVTAPFREQTRRLSLRCWSGTLANGALALGHQRLNNTPSRRRRNGNGSLAGNLEGRRVVWRKTS